MRFREFLKEKIVTIALLIFSIITIEILLMIYSFGTVIKLYIPIAIIFSYAVGILVEYYNKKKYYNNILNNLEELQDKYLIAEIMKTPNFVEGKILKSILEQTDKAMIENVNTYKYLQEDYKEYIELWIHEIKIPIAASKMIIENNKTPATMSIDEELNKIENYIEQALFYARSNTVEKDYSIKKNNLKDMVNETIKKNKNILIQDKIKIDIHDIDLTVGTDSKWCIFILNQIIQNSVKYMNKDIKTMKIYAEEKKEKVILYIQDNGMGVGKGEIARVYDKGFTGENGRILGKKSTGIGLYLCKKLCDRLGLGIEFNSQKDIGTEVKIIFPVGSHTNI